MAQNSLTIRDGYKAHSAEKWQDIGQSLYRQRKFQDACEAFSNAMASSKIPTLTLSILDNRAAALEKLENLQAALKDARRMIKLDPTAVQGYLRTGKILQMLDKSDLALQIYQLGLKNTSSKSVDYDKLHKKGRELASATLTGVDLMAKLPPELIEMIFSYLSFATLCKCLRVSGNWYKYLRSDARFWTTIDLSQATKPVSPQAYRTYLSLSRGKLRAARLKKIDLQNSKIIEKTTTHAPLLETLDILGSGLLSSTLTKGLSHAKRLKNLKLRNTPITGDSYRELLKLCPSLEMVEFGVVPASTISHRPFDFDTPNLRSFSINLIQSQRETFSMRLILPYAPNLEVLRIHDLDATSFLIPNPPLGDMKGLTELSLWIRCFPCPIPPSVILLDLRNTYPFLNPVHNPNNVLMPQEYLSKLSQLRICDDPDSAPIAARPNAQGHFACIERLLGDPQGQMEPLDVLELSISDAGVPSFDRIKSILEQPRTKNVRELYLRGINSLDDAGASFLAERFGPGRISRLDLSYTKVTGIGLKHIIQSMKSLRTLILEGSIISSDAVALARSLSITVSHSTLGW